uniref:Uncharacterized protein n=2 Tax=Timema TaxID=61471 RepID=A0A7R9DTV0_TIMPO|nr:unnamed protein product [Timema poppensis]
MLSTSNQINTTVPISPAVPKTSSGFVGWRSSQPQYTLERVGPLYTSPLKTIKPPQLIQTIPQQHVIFIG